MAEEMKGQIAIVTGGTRGIGKAITTRLLANGTTVIAVYAANTTAATEFQNQVEAEGGHLEIYCCDVAVEQQVSALFQHIEEKFGKLDILVNSAGVRRDAITALMSGQQWQEVIDTNLTGTFLMAKHAVLLMMQQKYGRIINITSPASYLGFPGQANYGASKAGQIGLTRSLAKEVARKKITVNCVSPGFIDTEFIKDLSEGQLAEYKKMVPMKRFGTAEEVAEAVLFLSGKNASYITGTTLEVSGGL